MLAALGARGARAHASGEKRFALSLLTIVLRWYNQLEAAGAAGGQSQTPREPRCGTSRETEDRDFPRGPSREARRQMSDAK